MGGGDRGGFGGGGGAWCRGQHDYARQSLGLPGSDPAAAKTPAAQAREQLVQYAQQSQFVNGRNFFQNGSQWMASEVQSNQAAKHVRIQFKSPEYFAFAAGEKQAGPAPGWPLVRTSSLYWTAWFTKFTNRTTAATYYFLTQETASGSCAPVAAISLSNSALCSNAG